eukprot:gnl/TRDRNA2_/TRDRNA2_167525_c2_seq4.p3 gnl/TRDRNA2_/TRDRNA2_167525_c2~~gnl/TRDRNA2_/TRDRNA2_167525_c2_seq4.p3  ORF type:complete len:153 (-),score=36.33 gnl/TRDRNA2_/TRDRNA2_167525_c2_seq4:449-907(-)
MDAFKSQELANAAWTFVTVSAPMSLATEVLPRLDAKSLGKIAWALAVAGSEHSTLGALALAAECCAGNFNVQDIANLAWTFATADQCEMSLFATLTIAAERCAQLFKAQDLANALWAFAKVCKLDSPLFLALASAAIPRAGDFSGQHLANVA